MILGPSSGRSKCDPLTRPAANMKGRARNVAGDAKFVAERAKKVAGDAKFVALNPLSYLKFKALAAQEQRT